MQTNQSPIHHFKNNCNIIIITELGYLKDKWATLLGGLFIAHSSLWKL